jgi:phosphomannomutase/phosphoglucomutase
MEETFPQAGFAAIHDRIDGLFRARDPDSSRPQHLRALAEAVCRHEADLGIAFDGDGDRVAFVDGDGRALTAEESTWILIQSFGAEWKDRAFVYDVKCSDRIPELVERLGGRPQAQRSGHAFIRARMLEQAGLFGAEISGHFFYDELGGGDDALFTACRMLSYTEACGQSLATLRRACPPIFTTADLRLTVEQEEQAELIEQIKLRFRHRPQRFVDGVRVDFSHGWVLVRRSVTASELTFRFEGKSARSLDRLIREFSAELGELGDRLREKREQEKAGRI